MLLAARPFDAEDGFRGPSKGGMKVGRMKDPLQKAFIQYNPTYLHPTLGALSGVQVLRIVVRALQFRV